MTGKLVYAGNYVYLNVMRVMSFFTEENHFHLDLN